MDCVNLKPTKLEGAIVGPGSKSMSHRAIVCAALSKGSSTITNIIYSDDIVATLKGVAQFGACVEYYDDYVVINGTNMFTKKEVLIDCNESGTTLRFLSALALLSNTKVRFIGKGLLGQRPMKPYFELFDKLGIYYCSKEGSDLDLIIEGKIDCKEICIQGDVSSQFISGLLFILPLLKEDHILKVVGRLESKDYVIMTIDVLKKYGIEIECVEDGYLIRGNQQYCSYDYQVEGDYSQLAFYAVAACLGSKIDLCGYSSSSMQGDKKLLDCLESMGVVVHYNKGTYHFDVHELQSITIDCSHIPDVVPVLALLCTQAKGKSVLSGLSRLRFKECDRLEATYQLLKQLVALISIEDDCLLIEGSGRFVGGDVFDGYQDHRMVMMLTIASTVCDNPISIIGSHCVSKSYPKFFEDFKMLGGVVDEFGLEK